MSNEETIEEDVKEEDTTLKPKQSLTIPRGLVPRFRSIIDGEPLDIDPFKAEYEEIKDMLKEANGNKAFSYKNYETLLAEYVDNGDITLDNKILKMFLTTNFRNMLKIKDQSERIVLLSTDSVGSVITGALFSLFHKLDPDQFKSYDDIKKLCWKDSISNKAEGKVIETFNKLNKLL